MSSARSAAKRLLQPALAVALLLPHIAMATSGGTTVTAKICHPAMAGTTLTTSTPNPTVSFTADLAGTTEANAAVVIVSSSTTVATILADASGNYAVTVGIAVGDNHLMATGTDACNHQTSSTELLITRVAVPPPAPTITEPADGASTTAATIIVAGTTEALATVTIYRGTDVVATLTADSLGNFSASIALSLGTNELSAMASNAAGPGPQTTAITVTRTVPPAPTPTPVPAPVVTPTPTPTPPPTPPATGKPATPTFVSPAGNVASSNAYTTLTVQGQAGTTLEIYRGDELVATLVIETTGPVTIQVPQNIGENTYTTQARRGNVVSGRSAPITTVRQAASPVAPNITEPHHDATTTEGSAWIGGTAAPGSTVNIYVGRRLVAQMLAGDDGTFRVSVPLHPGTNVIYAETIQGAESARSGLTLITYNPVGAAGQFGRDFLATLRAIANTAIGASLVALQAITDVVSSIVASRIARTLVLAAAIVAPIWARGLVGLEFFMAFISLSLQIYRRRGLPKTPIFDAVTGHRLNPFQARAGYVKVPGIHPGKIVVEPKPGPGSLGRLILDAILGLTSWVLLGLAVLVSLTLAATHPGVINTILAIIFTGLFVGNAWLVANQPAYHWGHLRDGKTGQMVKAAEVQLRSKRTGVVSSYQVRPDGRYTLWAEPGQYELTAWSHGYHPHQEDVTIKHHATYLGFKLALVRSHLHI